MLPDIRRRNQMADILGFGYRPEKLQREELAQVNQRGSEAKSVIQNRKSDQEPEVTRAEDAVVPQVAQESGPWNRLPDHDSRMRLSADGQVNALERLVRLTQDRLAMMESRLETLFGRFEDRGASDAESHRRVQIACRELDDQMQNSVRNAEDRIAALSDFKVRAERDSHVQREHVRSLQAEFQEFAINAVAKTRNDMEQAIKTHFVRHSINEDTWKQEMKKEHAMGRDELHRQRHMLEELDQKASASRSDTRGRLLALESAALQPHKPVPDNGFRPYFDELRSEVTKLRIQLVEAQQAIEEETLRRGENVREVRTVLKDLEHVAHQSYGDLVEKFTQNRDLMDSKMSSDRQDVLARLTQHGEGCEAKQHNLLVAMNEVEARLLGGIENNAKDEKTAREALRESMETKMQHLSQTNLQNEETRAATMASLQKNVEVFQQQQHETVHTIRQEVQDNLREIQVAIRGEVNQRLDSDQKMGNNLRDVAQHLQSLITTHVQNSQKQNDYAIKLIDEAQKDSSHRAERLSRYIDDVSGRLSQDTTRQREVVEERFCGIQGRLGDIYDTMERHLTHNEKERARLDEERSLKLGKVERQWSDLLEHDKRRCEQQKKFLDQKLEATENNLSRRLADYIEDFDQNVRSIQQAILGLTKDKGPIGGPIVSSLPKWENEVTVDVSDLARHGSQFNDREPFSSLVDVSFQDEMPPTRLHAVEVPGSPDTLPLHPDMRAVDSPFLFAQHDGISPEIVVDSNIVPPATPGLVTVSPNPTAKNEFEADPPTNPPVEADFEADTGGELVTSEDATRLVEPDEASEAQPDEADLELERSRMADEDIPTKVGEPPHDELVDQADMEEGNGSAATEEDAEGVGEAQVDELPEGADVEDGNGSAATEEDAEGVGKAQVDELPEGADVEDGNGSAATEEDAESVGEAQVDELPEGADVEDGNSSAATEEDPEGVGETQVDELPEGADVEDGNGSAVTEEDPESVGKVQVDELPEGADVEDGNGCAATEEDAESVGEAQVDELPERADVEEGNGSAATEEDAESVDGLQQELKGQGDLERRMASEDDTAGVVDAQQSGLLEQADADKGGIPKPKDAVGAFQD